MLQFGDRYLRYTHAHQFNGPLSGTPWVSRYQKGKTNLNFTEATESEWQWHLLGHMQVCTLLQTDNHASTPPGHHSVFTGRMPFLPPNPQRQSTEGKEDICDKKHKFLWVRCPLCHPASSVKTKALDAQI